MRADMDKNAATKRAEKFKIEHLRPFTPGEYRPNEDGTVSTELTVTVPDIKGGWMNVPSLWMSPGGWVELSEDEAAIAAQLYEQRAGAFPRYGSVDEATSAATKRSHDGGNASGALARPRYGLGDLGGY